MGKTGLRKFFIILGIAGLVLAVIYPFAVQNFGGYRLGAHEVYSSGGGFRTVDVELSDEEDPVRILVDYHSNSKTSSVMASATLSIRVESDGKEMIARDLEFIHSTPGEDSVHTGNYVYRATAGVIHPVGVKTYHFSFEPKKGTSLTPDRVELILMASAIEWDPRGQLLGYGLLALGMIGFVISTVGKGNKQPPGS